MRDRRGLNNEDIGLTNQKSINQSIAHHSVVFKPDELKMWVSTQPWQSGAFLCYDLRDLFENPKSLVKPQERLIAIPADTLFLKNDYQRILDYRKKYKEIKKNVSNRLKITEQDINSFIELNPQYYEVYNLVGDYYKETNDIHKALIYWEKSLNCEIPSVYEIKKIRNKIRYYDKE